LFDKMCERDIVSWSNMTVDYGRFGRGRDVIEVFQKMQQAGMKKNHINFVGVLVACRRASLVDEGLHYFDFMRHHHYITPQAKHYSCMMYLLGHTRHLDKALDVIRKMPFEPDISLLGACRVYSNIEIGKIVVELVFKLNPQCVGNNVLLSNIYVIASRWEDVDKVRTMMKDKIVKRSHGTAGLRSILECIHFL